MPTDTASQTQLGSPAVEEKLSTPSDEKTAVPFKKEVSPEPSVAEEHISLPNNNTPSESLHSSTAEEPETTNALIDGERSAQPVEVEKGHEPVSVETPIEEPSAGQSLVS